MSLDEVKIRLGTGQLGQDAHIECAELTHGGPKPIWMIDSLRHYADTPEARMMDHLRSNPMPNVSMVLAVLLVCMWLLQSRGWISSTNAGLGWSSVSIQNHWWVPWTHWGVHVDLAHWIGNVGLLYFCARRIERIIGSISLIWVLSWILWFVSVAVWQWETHIVVGASSWVFGLWAMQVGLGFRLVDSLPSAVQAHYGWGNFLIFIPMLVINTMSLSISNIAHWVAMLIGGVLSVLIVPQTSIPKVERKPRWSLGVNGMGHLLFMGVFVFLTTQDALNGSNRALPNGLNVVDVSNLVEDTWCEMSSWQQDGIVLYAGERWYDGQVSEQSLLMEDLSGCMTSNLQCAEMKSIPVNWSKEAYGSLIWRVWHCADEAGAQLMEYRLQRGQFGVRMGCRVLNDFAAEWCQTWLDKATVDSTLAERQAERHWNQHDQSGGKTLEYAQLLRLYGRWQEADRLYESMEWRFDDYRWRATEERLRMHRNHSEEWVHERLWMEQVARSLPMDEIDVLRQSVLLANERKWCDLSQNIWERWRTMMPTGLEDVESLVEQCPSSVEYSQ